MQTTVKVGYDVLSTRIHPKTKQLLAQLGHVGKKTTAEDGTVTTTSAFTDTDNAEVWGPGSAFVSRPPKPVAGKTAPQAAVVTAGDHDIVLAMADERGRDLLGELGYGEAGILAAGENGTAQARSLYKGDGSMTHMTRKGNVEGGVAIMIQMDAASGTISLVNDLGYGIKIGPLGVTISAKDAALTLGGDGNISLVGKGKTLVDGASILLGNRALPVVNSAITGPAGLVGKASLKTLIEGWLGPVLGFAALCGYAYLA